MASSRKPPPSKARRAAPAARAGAADPVRAALRASIARCGLRDAQVCVALSGGLDSVVLLHALARERERVGAGLRLRAMHVNHGLSPHARRWESACRAQCAALGLPFVARRVKLQRRGRGLESAAREARYAALAACGAARVALAHHRDDQAETVLLNLLRGAGLPGAAAMPETGRLPGSGPEPESPQAWRPLLGVSRAQLEDYARRHRLAWVEDESNADEALTRNWLRRALGPQIGLRFPRWREALARAAGHFAEAQALLAAGDTDALDLATLRALPPARARQRLRGFLAASGARAPSVARLGEMLRQLLQAAPDAATAVVHDGRLLRCWRGQLALLEPVLPAGEVALSPARGAGIDLARLGGVPLSVRHRVGGERLRLAANRPSRALKNLCQEAGIPPWERDLMPLLYCGDVLVWAPGIGIDVAFRAAGRRPGLVPEWRRLGSGAKKPARASA
jgi:tRNA(Ile)-lysidine synthase